MVLDMTSVVVVVLAEMDILRIVVVYARNGGP